MKPAAKGDRVLITSPTHPWSGHTGTVEVVETFMNKPAVRVTLDEGGAAGCRPSDIRVLDGDKE